MIYDRPLTPEEQHRSQRNLYCFNSINGISYMCLGETVLILLAVKLHAPNVVITVLGAMLYFGFLLLPLGKLVTAHVGGARSHAVFWLLRSSAAVGIASASLWKYLDIPFLPEAVLILGAFFFYGFRAAGVIMSQPLIGDVTDDSTRGRFIARLNTVFFAASLVSLVSISQILRHADSPWLLTAIICFGASCGFFTTGFLRKIDETRNIMLSAREPYGPECRWAIRFKPLRKQLAAGFMANLAVILVGPMAMLALKRGLGFSDSEALYFAIAQFSGSAIISFAGGEIVRKLGAQREMLLGYALLILIALVWVLLPAEPSVFLLAVTFFCIGGGGIILTNTTQQFLLETVPVERRVAASIFSSIVTGAGAGIGGMLAGALLIRLSEYTAPAAAPSMAVYKHYFLLTALLLLPGLFVIRRLRKIRKITAG